MAWITITESDLIGSLTGPEMTAVQSAALGAGQTDPIPEKVLEAVQEIRGRVAACQNNRLGDLTQGEQIPEELKPAALAIIRYRILIRLPLSSLITPQREREYTDALTLLSAVAACKFRIEQPAYISAQIIAGPAVTLASSEERKMTRDSMRGL